MLTWSRLNAVKPDRLQDLKDLAKTTLGMRWNALEPAERIFHIT